MDEHEPTGAPPADPTSTPSGPSGERHPDDLAPDPSVRAGIPRGVLWAAALFVVVLTIAGWVALSTDSSPKGSAGGSAGGPVVILDPNATIPTAPEGGGLQRRDLTGQVAPAGPFRTFTGGEANIASFRGRPVLVNFWGSYCGPCISEMPDLERIKAKYGDRLQIVGFDVQDGETAARQMAERTGVTYLLGFDPSAAIAGSFSVASLPTTVMIGRDGTVTYSRTGARNFDELSALIDENLHP
jgi:thiol-disulfide isomerase/thioredoxin